MCVCICVLQTRFFWKTQDSGSEPAGQQLLVLPATQRTLHTPLLLGLHASFSSSLLARWGWGVRMPSFKRNQDVRGRPKPTVTLRGPVMS